MAKEGAVKILLAILLSAGTTTWAQDTPAPSTVEDPAKAPGTAAAPEKGTPASDVRDPVFYPGDTERFKPLIHKMVANLWLDQKEIWTSPFQMRAKDAKWWIGFGAATAALVATDSRSSGALNDNPTQVRWAQRVSQIGASYTLIPVIAGFYAYGVIKDDAKPREVGVLGTEALLDGLIVVEILKTIGGRNRPDSTTDKGKFFSGGTSFPSGHAIESWAIASLIAHEYKHTKIVPIVVYSLAGVISAARFTAQKHYASDILAGGAMGWFIGKYVYKTHMDHAIHHQAWMRPNISPQFDPVSRTYAVALTFGQ